ncbi:Gfo/Idh/MocA family oxidoreductase [Roseomonas sp. M0104]|uniref:Gfo/Idh/MocA family oxidoreductase n=1 Tax=Teichococcus coralli TaxID=2545983 RepID=A0A845BG91_9PROT|nr:Gfo/Idh/MocA family oxidoreductase [Pseudoroseomonas coralli]MXP65918.1 Gfo/Idh/MocA family oxidoreductase [Pseudoroseomonas coralli]
MPVGVGLIGLGMATAPHMLALRDLVIDEKVSIVGGFSPSAGRREAFAERWKVPVFATQEELLAQPELGLVLILTPPGTHLPVAEAVARSGRAMIVEKPVEVSVQRGEALAELAERHGVACGVCLQHRFRPAALRLRQALQDGELGRILSASASIRWWRDAAYFAEPGRGTRARDGGGVLLTQAIHTLDLLLHLVGPHRALAGFAATSPLRRIDTEDIVAAALQFENGAIGVLDATTVARPGYPERIEIAGTEGSAVLEGSHLTLHGRGAPETLGATAAGGGADPMAFDHAPHRVLIADVLEAMATGRAPACDVRSALAVQRLIEDLLRDAEARA